MTQVENIWLYDSSRRVYIDDDGKKHNTPVYAKSFVKYEVVRETSQSWVIQLWGRDFRIAKNQEKCPYVVAFSEAEVQTLAWVNDNAYKISEQVRKVKDYTLLKDIAKLIGYESA